MRMEATTARTMTRPSHHCEWSIITEEHPMAKTRTAMTYSDMTSIFAYCTRDPTVRMIRIPTMTTTPHLPLATVNGVRTARAKPAPHRAANIARRPRR